MKDSISIIAAVADNMAIGRSGSIPWHISEDFKYFKKVTKGHTVIMGKGTWRSLGGKCLKDRRNMVISHSPASDADTAAGAEFYKSLTEAIQAASGDGEIFIIGGGSLYRQAMNLAESLYITEIYTSIPDADTFFPEIDKSEWNIASRGELLYDEESNLNFRFLKYERK